MGFTLSGACSADFSLSMLASAAQHGSLNSSHAAIVLSLNDNCSTRKNPKEFPRQQQKTEGSRCTFIVSRQQYIDEEDNSKESFDYPCLSPPLKLLCSCPEQQNDSHDALEDESHMESNDGSLAKPASLPLALEDKSKSVNWARALSTLDSEETGPYRLNPIEEIQRDITCSIRACTSWTELKDLYQIRKQQFNGINVCALIVAIRHVVPSKILNARPAAGMGRKVGWEDTSCEHASELRGEPRRGVVGGLRGKKSKKSKQQHPRARHYESSKDLLGMRATRERREVLSFIHEVLVNSLHLVPSFSPRGMAGCMYTIAKINMSQIPQIWMEEMLSCTHQQVGYHDETILK